MSRSPAKSGKAITMKSLKEKWERSVQSVRENREKEVGGSSIIIARFCSVGLICLPQYQRYTDYLMGQVRTLCITPLWCWLNFVCSNSLSDYLVSDWGFNPVPLWPQHKSKEWTDNGWERTCTTQSWHLFWLSRLSRLCSYPSHSPCVFPLLLYVTSSCTLCPPLFLLSSSLAFTVSTPFHTQNSPKIHRKFMENY